MKINAPLIIASMLALAVASGCAMFDGGGAHIMDTPCTAASGAVCVITIKVESCQRITAHPEHARVADNDQGDIEWRVEPGNWSFTDQGIEFKNPHSDFSNRRNMKSAYKWHNAHTAKNKRHRYWIEVTDGGQVCRKDPSIMN